MKVVLAYITTKDKAQAVALGRKLLESKVVACTNILDSMESSYWWKGKLETSQETVLIAKTLESHKEKVLAMVSREHSYECPCILFLPVEGGHGPYLNWLKESLET